jgi:hypothetical protein
MAEYAKQYLFSHKAIVEELIKREGIHDGLWMLTIELGLTGTNVNAQTPEGKASLSPAGIVSVGRIGISRTDHENDLTVDASKVNPHPRSLKTSNRSTRIRLPQKK